MLIGNFYYGVGYLPEGNIPYREGYRYGAYNRNIKTEETHITEFFKTIDEVTDFVNEHNEYKNLKAKGE